MCTFVDWCPPTPSASPGPMLTDGSAHLHFSCCDVKLDRKAPSGKDREIDPCYVGLTVTGALAA